MCEPLRKQRAGSVSAHVCGTHLCDVLLPIHIWYPSAAAHLPVHTCQCTSVWYTSASSHLPVHTWQCTCVWYTSAGAHLCGAHLPVHIWLLFSFFTAPNPSLWASTSHIPGGSSLVTPSQTHPEVHLLRGSMSSQMDNEDYPVVGLSQTNQQYK